MDILPGILTPVAEWQRWDYNNDRWKYVVDKRILVWLYDLEYEWHVVFNTGIEELPKSTFKNIEEAMLYVETKVLLLNIT